MKKLYTRIAACSLAVLIAFNTVAIPKSRAVVVESALSSAIIGTYLTASGFAFTGNGTAVGTPADMYIAERLDVFLRDWSEAMDKTDEEIRDVIVSGFEFVGDGVVKVGSAAAGLLASFTDWLVDKMGLIGEDGEPVTEPVGFVPSVGDMCLYNGVELPMLPDYDESAYPYAIIVPFDSNYRLWLSDSPFVDISSGTTYGFATTTNNAVQRYDNSSGDAWGSYTTRTPTNGLYTVYAQLIWSNHDILTTSGSFYLAASEPVASEDWDNPVLYTVLSPDYEVAPTVDEQYAMVIDTGMTIEDEQDFVDSVLGGMLAGTLAPTYSIEQAAGGDVVVPGEDEETDTQAGILSSVKNIAQNVIALPQTIAEAIKGIFVPDTALTTEITDAFAEKFAFVPTLHRLGTDLLSIGPDSTPPVVYIHLEDAEGAIDYGGTTKALDMSWYQRYKEDGDRIIGGFLWLSFLWLLFKRVPAIINGGEMMTEQREDLDDGYRSRRGRKH